MSLKSKILKAAYLVLLSLGLSLYLQLVISGQRLSVLHHAYPFNFLFLILFILSFLFFLSLWVALRRIFQFLWPTDGIFSALGPIFLPFSGFLLSPFLLCFYWSRQDLFSRLGLLALFIVLASLVITLITYEKANQGITQRLKLWINKFSLLPKGKKILILFFIAFFIYQIATLILVLKGVTFSGDEPNYLLITHSVIYDGDINLANNYAHQDYFAFYSREEHPRLKLGIYGRYGKKGKDYIYPINLPGISVLMVPFYALSQLVKGKLLTFILKGSLAVWASLFSLQIYLLCRQRWAKESLALGLWFLASFTPPVLFYANHLYPEMPIAFFSLLIFRRLILGCTISPLETLGLGFLLATFPWFGLKYNFIFWPLLILSLYQLGRRKQPKKLLVALFFFPLISQLLFYFFIYHLYGTFSPIAIYEGVMTTEQLKAFKQMVLEIPLLLRLESFLDYFLDQRDGLLLYSPFYFFALAGFIDLFRRSKKLFLALLFIGLPFLFNYSFFTHRQGYSPQARVLMPLIWIGVLALAEFISTNKKRVFGHLFYLSAFISFVFAFLLLTHPPFLYQPTTHEFTSRPGNLFVFLSNTHFLLSSFLPSFIKINNIGYWPNYFWVILILLILLFYARSRHRFLLECGLGWRTIFAFFLIASFLWVLFPRPPLYPVKTITYSPQRSLGFYNFYLSKGVVAKEKGDFYLHLEKTYRFIFGSKQELKKVQVILGSETGDYEINLKAFDLPLFQTIIQREKRSLEFDLPPPYRYQHLYLYEITLKMRHLSSESMLLEPFLVQIIPGRR